SCSAMASRLQLVAAPRPLLRMAGEVPLRPLDDPRGHTPIRFDGLHQAELLRVRLVLRHRSTPLDLDVPPLRDHALEDLTQGRIVDLPLHAPALRQLDELVLDVLLQLGIGELDAPESFPRLRRQDLPQDRLPLGLDLFAVLHRFARTGTGAFPRMVGSGPVIPTAAELCGEARRADRTVQVDLSQDGGDAAVPPVRLHRSLLRVHSSPSERRPLRRLDLAL